MNECYHSSTTWIYLLGWVVIPSTLWWKPVLQANLSTSPGQLWINWQKIAPKIRSFDVFLSEGWRNWYQWLWWFPDKASATPGHLASSLWWVSRFEGILIRWTKEPWADSCFFIPYTRIDRINWFYFPHYHLPLCLCCDLSSNEETP